MAPNAKIEDDARKRRNKSFRRTMRSLGLPIGPIQPRVRDPQKQVAKRRTRRPNRKRRNQAKRILLAKEAQIEGDMPRSRESQGPPGGPSESPAHDHQDQGGQIQGQLKDSEGEEGLEDALSLEGSASELEEVPEEEKPGQEGAEALDEEGTEGPVLWDFLDPIDLFDNADEALDFYY